MDILSIFHDYGIDYVTDSGHRHAREDWVNVECPFCTGEHEGYHLGWSLDEEYFKCWRCGYHPPVKTLASILSITINETLELIKSYGVVRSYTKKLPEGKKEFLLPYGIMKLKPRHKAYLRDRDFSPSKLEKIWGIQGTGPLSYLRDGDKEIDYRFRLFLPIYWNGEMVSYDTRDITGRDEATFGKYKACPVNREIVERKKILYGIQDAWGETGICVEGPSDVWRFGTSSFAVSGIAYTPQQVSEMAKAFTKIAVVFDEEPQAIKQGRKLVKDLQFRNVDAYQVRIKGDPGSMGTRAANKLVKNILNKK